MNYKLFIGLSACSALTSGIASAAVAACGSYIGDAKLVMDLALCFGGTGVICLGTTIYCLCISSADQESADQAVDPAVDRIELSQPETPAPTVPMTIVVDQVTELDPERSSSNELPPQRGPFNANALLYAPSPQLKADGPRR